MDAQATPAKTKGYFDDLPAEQKANCERIMATWDAQIRKVLERDLGKYIAVLMRDPEDHKKPEGSANKKEKRVKAVRKVKQPGVQKVRKATANKASKGKKKGPKKAKSEKAKAETAKDREQVGELEQSLAGLMLKEAGTTEAVDVAMED